MSLLDGELDCGTFVSVAKAPGNDERMTKLKDYFIEEFNQTPEFYVKVPGRVNLIGEHIDYCGFPVLPMAIEQSIILAVTQTQDGILHLKNIDSKYKPFKCCVNTFKIEVPEKGGPQWYNYFLCGVKGVIERLTGDKQTYGMMIAVSGNIPAASGLSSSSALVSAATLSTAYVHNMPLNKQNLAEISAKCERYIGTQGGGMDQAIAFLAQDGCAQFIEWNPLTATPVCLPQNSIFVIANSLAEANKAANSDFNQRVVECQLGCRIISRKLGLPWRDITRLATLQDILKCTLEELDEIIDENLPLNLYTRNDIIKELNVTEEEFHETLLSANTKHLNEFKLRQRSQHVANEALRVFNFREAAERGDIRLLSELMRQSHESLKTMYECSHKNLNHLVNISDEKGIGARLTGAGWGGCIVALCDSIDACNSYIEELKKLYYTNLPQAEGRDLNEIVFATSPQSGAQIFIETIIK